MADSSNVFRGSTVTCLASVVGVCGICLYMLVV